MLALPKLHDLAVWRRSSSLHAYTVFGMDNVSLRLGIDKSNTVVILVYGHG